MLTHGGSVAPYRNDRDSLLNDRKPAFELLLASAKIGEIEPRNGDLVRQRMRRNKQGSPVTAGHLREERKLGMVNVPLLESSTQVNVLSSLCVCENLRSEPRSGCSSAA